MARARTAVQRVARRDVTHPGVPPHRAAQRRRGRRQRRVRRTAHPRRRRTPRQRHALLAAAHQGARHRHRGADRHRHRDRGRRRQPQRRGPRQGRGPAPAGRPRCRPATPSARTRGSAWPSSAGSRRCTTCRSRSGSPRTAVSAPFSSRRATCSPPTTPPASRTASASPPSRPWTPAESRAPTASPRSAARPPAPGSPRRDGGPQEDDVPQVTEWTPNGLPQRRSRVKVSFSQRIGRGAARTPRPPRPRSGRRTRVGGPPVPEEKEPEPGLWVEAFMEGLKGDPDPAAAIRHDASKPAPVEADDEGDLK